MKAAFAIIVGLATLGAISLRGQDFLCAEVKIEIEQELTLARQAFEARMRIINGLELPLNNIQVEVRFFDSSGNVVRASSNPNETDPEVLFFIAESGSGVPASVEGSSDNRFTWLIIPTIAAGGELPDGVVYAVGATLTYTVGNTGVEEVVDVIPDDITVLPLPEIRLDYFLPFDVYGDNPDTRFIVEEPEPFSLGVRVMNIGFGTARDLKIESAQPRIVENQLGLLINFVITGTEINGVNAPNSLLIDFGDIAPASTGFAATARWIMETTLSGRFTQFDATVSHADELGGALTALLTDDNLFTHELVREVLVDLPGRDNRMDFLGAPRDDRTSLTVYESNAVDSPVTNYTVGEGATLPEVNGKYEFTVAGEFGFFYVRFKDPFDGLRPLTRVSRIDGKVLRPENAWLNRTWNKDLDEWEYWFSVFDGASAGVATYTVDFGPEDTGPAAPVLAFILDKTTVPDRQVGFIVSASDRNGDPIEISANNLPAGAQLNPAISNPGFSSSFFNWRPTADQVGTFAVEFVATDPSGRRDTQVVHIYVVGSEALSGYASFARRYFGNETNPAIIGPFADPDFDLMVNLLEYAQGTHPLIPDREKGPVAGLEVVGDETFVSLTYQRRTDDPSIVFEVLAADEARAIENGALATTEVAVSQSGLPEGLERVRVLDSVPISAANPRRFLELFVSEGSN